MEKNHCSILKKTNGPYDKEVKSLKISFLNNSLVLLARDRGHSHLVVSFSWFVWAVTLFFGLTEVISFDGQSHTGIVSWVSKNSYPKKQEIFWFLAFVVGVPMVVFLANTLHQRLFRGAPRWLSWLACCLCTLGIYDLYQIDPKGSLKTSLVTGCLSIILGVIFYYRFRKEIVSEERLREPKFLLREEKVRIERMALSLKYIKVGVLLIGLPIYIYIHRYVPNIYGRVDLFHEGEFLVPLYEYLKGAVPYRDIYLQHGLLHNLGVPFLAVKLFGESLASVRAMHAILEPLGWVGAYLLLCCLTKLRFLPAIAFAILCSMTHISIQERAFFGCSALALFALYLQTQFRYKSLLLMSGLLTGMALLYSVEVGFYALGASGVLVLLLEYLKLREKLEISGHPLFQMLVGLSIPWAPFLIYLIYHGGLWACIQNLHTQVFYQLEVWGLPFPNPLLMFTKYRDNRESLALMDWFFSRRVTLIYAPILLSMAGTGLAYLMSVKRGRWSSDTLALLLMCLSGIFFFRTNLGRSDGGHFAYGYMISLMICCYGMYGFCRKVEVSFKNKNFMGGVLGLILACLCLWFPWTWIEKNTPKGYEEGRERRSEASLFPLKSDEEIIPDHMKVRIKALKEFINKKTEPADRLYDFSNQCGHLFFTKRRSASRYFMPVYAVLESHQKEVIADMEAHHVDYVFYRSQRYFRNVDGFPTMERTPLLLKYIHNNFSRYKTIGGIEVWRRYLPQRNLTLLN